jgi:hypothetical protein
MEIKRSGSQPSTKESSEYFTGIVRIDPLFQANDPARAVGASVTFEPLSLYCMTYSSTRLDSDYYSQLWFSAKMGR